MPSSTRLRKNTYPGSKGSSRHATGLKAHILTLAAGVVLVVIVAAAALQVWQEISFSEQSTRNQLRARATFLEQQIDVGAQLANELADVLSARLGAMPCGQAGTEHPAISISEPTFLSTNIAFWPDKGSTCISRVSDLKGVAEDMSTLFAISHTIGISRLTAHIPGGWLSIPMSGSDDLAKPPSAVRLDLGQADLIGLHGWLNLHADRADGNLIESWIVQTAGKMPVSVEIDIPAAWFWQFTLPFEGSKSEIAILDTKGNVLARGNGTSSEPGKQAAGALFAANAPFPADIKLDFAEILASKDHSFSANGVRATFESLGEKPFIIASVVQNSDLIAFAIARNTVLLITIAILTLFVLIGYVALQLRVLAPARRAERALMQLSERLQATFAAVPVGICLADADNSVVTSNDRFDMLVGKAQPVDGAAAGSNGPAPDNRVKMLVGEKDDLEADEHVFKAPTDRSLLVRSAPVGESGQLVITVTDITERAQMELDLAKARDDAESASRSKAEFLATMSHEIRTPMNGVIGMVDLLARTQLTPSQRRSLSTIRESAYALLRIINDILDFSKIEAGRLEIESLPTSLTDIVEGALAPLAVAASSKKIRLLTYIDLALPEFVRGDAIRIRQILVNLCGNAVKFSSGGEVAVRADLEPDRPGWVRFSVTDHGIGISEEAQKKLFQQFSQAETSTTRRFGGTGLGLAICKRLCEMMGGTISVSSVVGLGTRFTVSLPLPAVEPSAESMPRLDFAGRLILIVSRSVDERAICRSYLEQHRATVQEVDRLDDLVEAILRGQSGGRRMPLIVFLSDLDTSEVEGATTRITEAGAAPRMVVVLRDATIEENPFSKRNDVLTVEAQPMRRSAFVNAISVALGLASPDALRSEDAPDLDQEATVPSIVEAEQRRELILVAEDNITNQEVIEGQLAKLGYACEVVDNGKIALNAWMSGRFSVVLTDCHMPVMDGFELTRKIRLEEASQALARTPIIAITANAMRGEAERCLSSGMDDYLAKPVELKTLKATIVKWLKRQSTASQENSVQAAATQDLAVPQSEEAILDLTLLRETFADNELKVRQVLQRFLTLGQELIDQIVELIARKDADALGETSHKLKSSALTTGANALAEACKQLEAASEDADWSIISSIEARLLPEFERVKERVGALS